MEVSQENAAGNATNTTGNVDPIAARLQALAAQLPKPEETQAAVIVQDPAAVVNTEEVKTGNAAVVQSTGEVKTEIAADGVKTENKDDWWKDPLTTASKTTDVDYKSLFEQNQSKTAELQKLFENPVVANLIEIVNAPGFEMEKFLDGYKGQDVSSFETEDLFRMKCKADTVANYNDDEIDQLWADELAKPSAVQKKLRSDLVAELKPKLNLKEEHPYIKQTKEVLAQQKEQEQREQAVFTEFRANCDTFVDTLEGKEIHGVAITKEDIAKAKATMDGSYYKDPTTGQLNHQALMIDRIKIVKMAAVIDKLITEGVAQETQRIAKPDLGNGSGATMQVQQGALEQLKNSIINSGEIKHQNVVNV